MVDISIVNGIINQLTGGAPPCSDRIWTFFDHIFKDSRTSPGTVADVVDRHVLSFFMIEN